MLKAEDLGFSDSESKEASSALLSGGSKRRYIKALRKYSFLNTVVFCSYGTRSWQIVFRETCDVKRDKVLDAGQGC